MRHNSDSTHHQNAAAVAFARLMKLFQSRSDSNIKLGLKSDPTNKSDSNKSRSKTKTRSVSSSSTDEAPKRRLVRVVRDSEAQAPEKIDDNPHRICRYSQQFLEEHYKKSQNQLLNKPLPYVTSGHTILKTSSTDPTPSCGQYSPAVGKHATFKELVEIIEFSGQDVLRSGARISREERLHDDELEASDHEREPGFFLRDDLTGDTDLEYELEAGISQLDEADEAEAKTLALDLNRMDGIMKNIFSSVANVHEPHSSQETAKIRRIGLSELTSYQCSADEQPELAKHGNSS